MYHLNVMYISLLTSAMFSLLLYEELLILQVNILTKKYSIKMFMCSEADKQKIVYLWFMYI